MSVCAAAVKLRRGKVAILGEPLTIPGLPVISVLAILSMVGLIALAKPAEQIALAVLLVGGVVLYYVMRAIHGGAKA
jgi:hypothetical protein